MTSSDKPQESESRSTGEQDTTSTTTTADATATSVSGGMSTDTAESGVDAGGRSDSDSETDGSEPAPPWQRTSSTSSSAAPGGDGGQESTAQETAEQDGTASETGSDSEETHKIPHPLRGDSEPVEGASAAESARSSVSFAAAGGVRGSGTSTQGSSRRPNRGPRRASLQVRRVDPWSVLKLALVLSVTLFFIWMIAVAVLYGVLGGMGVWEQLNGTFSDLTQPENSLSEPLISAGRVFGVAMIIGAVNIVLTTALATVAGFIYNVAADFVGGIELTLSERE